MLIWLIFAGILAAVLAAVLWPLLRPVETTEDASGFDRAVYRDQLREIDADVERGLISKTDAEAARLEVSRRLLATADAQSVEPTRQGRFAAGSIPLISIIASSALVLTMLLYGIGGSPKLSGRPFSEQSSAASPNTQIGQLIAQVEERLRQHPDDGKGWDVLAPVYLRLERYHEAAEAFGHAIEFEGESAKRLAGLGEALVADGNGTVSEQARRTFEKLLKLEPQRPDARFWLAMAKEQNGKKTEAAADYRALLAEAPPDAPWRAAVEEQLNKLGERPQPGPNAGDIAAASKMTEEARNRMIIGMVDGLAQKLKRDPHDIDGWLRLIRAYSVLGRREDAVAAVREARKVHVGETAALQSIGVLVKELKLGT